MDYRAVLVAFVIDVWFVYKHQSVWCSIQIEINYNEKHVRPQKRLWFLVSTRVASAPRFGIFNFLFCCYETMSNCSQNCWIDWNSAVLCFKRLFHILWVWTFAQFVRPLLATILCIWEIWSPRIQSITYFPVGKTKILKPTDDQKPVGEVLLA